MSKPREFWIDVGTNEVVPEYIQPSQCDIHVIEKSSYDVLIRENNIQDKYICELEQDNHKLTSALKIAKDALEFLRENRIHDTRVTVLTSEALKQIDSIMNGDEK